ETVSWCCRERTTPAITWRVRRRDPTLSQRGRLPESIASVSRVTLAGAGPGEIGDGDPGAAERRGVAESSRANADDRRPVASLGRVEGGDGLVEGRDVANVGPQSPVSHSLDDLAQLGAAGPATGGNRPAALRLVVCPA